MIDSSFLKQPEGQRCFKNAENIDEDNVGYIFRI